MSSQILQPPRLIMTKLNDGYVHNDDHGRSPKFYSDGVVSDSNVPEAGSVADRSCKPCLGDENLESITDVGSSKQTITPRTSSLATFLSLGGDEQFHLDSDNSRTESFRSMNSIPASHHEQTNVLESAPVLSKVTDSGTSPNSCSYIEQDDPGQVKEDSYGSHLPQEEENTLEPGLSMDSSLGASLSSPYSSTNWAIRPREPPSNTTNDGFWYIGTGRQASGQALSGGKTRKVHPIVYSAIGSLESVNQGNLGSFNSKLMLAATTKRGKKKQIKVDATTSHISERVTKGDNLAGSGVMGRNTLTTDGKVKNGTNKFADLSSKLSSKVAASRKPDRKISTLSSTLSSSIPHGEENTGHGSQSQVDDLIKPAMAERAQTIQASNTSNVKSIIKPDEKISSPRNKKKGHKKKKVTIDSKPKEMRHVELFRPSCDAYTPRMGRKEIKYKPAEERAGMEEMSTKMGTIQRPNFKDALRRVAMIIQQHIVKIEQRFEDGADHLNLFSRKMRDAFDESNFVTPRYKCTIAKLPMARAGVVYGMRKIRLENKIPTADDIYQFAHRLFKQVQLSSECSIICLIYVERLMETAKVPVMAKTWRPIFMCGLLLASKVWQDWSSWNIEFASVYPSFSLEAINKLELQFLKMVKWDLYISSSLYAKYYFALRSLLEKQDFRRKYVRMVGGVDNVSASEAQKISKRSELLKEKSLAYLSLSV